MTLTDYVGIDYSHGIDNTNRDEETGIRYGVISQNDVLQQWADSSEPWYGNGPIEVECPHCGHEEQSMIGEDVICNECCEEYEAELPDFAEPVSYVYDEDGYVCECDESGDIFIIKSLYYTYAQFCSPCAPGACHLSSPLEESARDENNKCYCFGHDWFDSEVAPYPVYSVETGELIEPKKS